MDLIPEQVSQAQLVQIWQGMRIKLGEAFQKVETAKQIHKTQVLAKVLFPIFEETFAFILATSTYAENLFKQSVEDDEPEIIVGLPPDVVEDVVAGLNPVEEALVAIGKECEENKVVVGWVEKAKDALFKTVEAISELELDEDALETLAEQADEDEIADEDEFVDTPLLADDEPSAASPQPQA